MKMPDQTIKFFEIIRSLIVPTTILYFVIVVFGFVLKADWFTLMTILFLLYLVHGHSSEINRLKVELKQKNEAISSLLKSEYELKQLKTSMRSKSFSRNLSQKLVRNLNKNVKAGVMPL
jgi:hypothetical protein